MKYKIYKKGVLSGKPEGLDSSLSFITSTEHRKRYQFAIWHPVVLHIFALTANVQ